MVEGDIDRAFFKWGDLSPGDTRDDGTVTLCTLRAATVRSRACRADFGRPLTKNVMSHSRDGPGVTAPLRTNLYLSPARVWNPPLPLPPLTKSPNRRDSLAFNDGIHTPRRPNFQVARWVKLHFYKSRDAGLGFSGYQLIVSLNNTAFIGKHFEASRVASTTAQFPQHKFSAQVIAL